MAMGQSASAKRRDAVLEKFPVGTQLAAIVDRLEWVSQELVKAGSTLPNDDFAKLVTHIVSVKVSIKKPKGEH